MNILKKLSSVIISSAMAANICSAMIASAVESTKTLQFINYPSTTASTTTTAVENTTPHTTMKYHAIPINQSVLNGQSFLVNVHGVDDGQIHYKLDLDDDLEIVNMYFDLFEVRNKTFTGNREYTIEVIYDDGWSEKVSFSVIEDCTKPTVTYTTTADPFAKTTSTNTTTGFHSDCYPTSTAIGCYATKVDYDASPMKVGEKRKVMIWNPETGSAKNVDFYRYSNNFDVDYCEGSDCFYIIALEPGTVELEVREVNCAFSETVKLEVNDSAYVPASEAAVYEVACLTDYLRSAMPIEFEIKGYNKAERDWTVSFGGNYASACKVTYTGPNTFTVVNNTSGDTDVIVKFSDGSVSATTLHILSSTTRPFFPGDNTTTLPTNSTTTNTATTAVENNTDTEASVYKVACLTDYLRSAIPIEFEIKGYNKAERDWTVSFGGNYASACKVTYTGPNTFTVVNNTSGDTDVIVKFSDGSTSTTTLHILSSTTRPFFPGDNTTTLPTNSTTTTSTWWTGSNVTTTVTTTTTSHKEGFTKVDYDDSAMGVGEQRVINFWNSETGEARDASIFCTSKNVRVLYTKGDDSITITALAPGKINLSIREIDCIDYAEIELDVYAHDMGEFGASSDKATQVDYSLLPLAKGETMPVYFWNPQTGFTESAEILDYSNNISLTYTPGENVVYVTALEDGSAYFILREKNCKEATTVKLSVYTVDPTNDPSLDIGEVSTILGDVNCDFEVNLADAVLIMQNVVNPDRYPLSEQGRKNADVDGGGVTTKDALLIQRFKLGLSKELG